MQDLLPEYGPQWRYLDLFYLWLWNEALTKLVPELRTDLTRSMVWIVRRRYLELMLTERASREGGVMHYSDWWRKRTVNSPLDMCVALPDRNAMQRFVREMWKGDVVHPVSASIHSGEHQTMKLHVPGEPEEISLIVHVTRDDFTLRNCRCSVQILDEGDTFRCVYTVVVLGRKTAYSLPLMQVWQ